MCRYTRTDRSCGHYEDEDIDDGKTCLAPCQSRPDNTTTTTKPGKCDLCVTKEKRQRGQLPRTQAQIDADAARKSGTAPPAPSSFLRPRTARAKKLAEMVAADEKAREEALKAGKPVKEQHRAEMEADAAAAVKGKGKGKGTQAQAQMVPSGNSQGGKKLPPGGGTLAVRTLAPQAADKTKGLAVKAAPVGGAVVGRTGVKTSGTAGAGKGGQGGMARAVVVGGTSKD